MTTDIATRGRMLREFDARGDTQRAYPAHRVEMRAGTGADHERLFVGHASITDHPYPVYGGPEAGGWNETVVSGAFAKTLSERADVAFLLNHAGMTLARTKSGTMTLTEDEQGLAVEARLDDRQSAVADIAIAMERGDLDEMSFAFRVIRDKWLTADGEEVPWWDIAGIDRRILEVSLNKGDVSVVNYGANPATSADLRSLFAEVRSGRPMSDHHRRTLFMLAGVTEPSPPPPADPAAPPRMSVALARALAQS